MNELVDVFSLVCLFINLSEEVMHQSEQIDLKLIKLVDTDLGVENSLEAKECKNEIIEDKLFLACDHGFLLSICTSFTTWTSDVTSHQSKPRSS
jgi:hypothetical protein